MPVRPGNERLQVSFPLSLKEELIKAGQEEQLSFQKFLISICQKYLNDKNAPTTDLKTIDLSDPEMKELYTIFCNMNSMDLNQKKLMKAYINQLKDISELILSINKKDSK